jgi:Protein of unknown function (DUF1153)
MVDNSNLMTLPPPDTKRWVVSRKAAVVQAVRNGSISLEEACRRYCLSSEEFLAWERAVDRYGIPGLRATRIQIYRDTDEARAAKQIRAARRRPPPSPPVERRSGTAGRATRRAGRNGARWRLRADPRRRDSR